MILSLARRMLVEPAPRVRARFFFTFGLRGMRAMRAFQRRAAAGDRSPAVLFISLTDRCNLACKGCWVTPAQPPREIPPETLDALITEWKERRQANFFGFLGGEPLLYPHLLAVIERHPDCYFQVLTNGTLLDDDMAAAFRRLGNVTPLISIEGDAAVSDERRGGSDVWARGMAALDCCRRHRLVFGVASSICKNNLEALASDAFLKEMIRRGAHYAWYYIYRPVGPDPAPELALDEGEILRLRRFLVEARCRHPIVIVDAYWDAEGRALCPAAEGVSHHIGPGGDMEPCPPIQFSAESVGTGGDVAARFQSSAFLEGFRSLAAEKGRGCILLSDPAALKQYVETAGARDTTGRGRGLEELAGLSCRPCHDLPGREIRERHFLYRLAKRRWFLGFGTYG